MICCDHCRVQSEKSVADADGWLVLELDGEIKRVYCAACSSTAEQMRERSFASKRCMLASLRPLSTYMEAK